MALRTHLLWFFEDSSKTTAHSVAGFIPFSAFFVKVFILGHTRSGHQVRSSDTSMKTNTIAPHLQCLRESYEAFGIYNKVVVTTKRICQFFICDLKSGHFHDHPIISQWAKTVFRALAGWSLLKLSYHVKHLLILKMKFFVTDPS